MEEIIKEGELNKIVEKIVSNWNDLVKNFENTTIRLCLMINEYIKKYPDNTVKEILKKVRLHPEIKRFVSIDRIWQGMRLIRKRPDLIDYHSKSEEEKKNTVGVIKPYLKKDGEIFWEFYFELAKQPLSDNMLIMLEQDGIKNKWSYRELRQRIVEVKEELEEPGAFEIKRKEKYELIKKIIAISRTLKVEQLRGVFTFCEELRKQDKGGE